MVSSAPTTTLPVISLAVWNDPSSTAEEKKEFATSVCRICHEIGFFLLVDHGVDVLPEVFSMSRKLFRLSLDEKKLIDKRGSRHFRGWEGLGTEHTNGRPDQREQVDLWSEHEPMDPAVQPPYLRLLGPNQWLPEDVLPNFRPLMSTWFEKMGHLADTVLEIFAVGLGLEPHHFEGSFKNQGMCLTKLIRYPPTPVGQAGVNAHHDTGFLTLLACETTPGLQVENQQGDWFDVTPPSPDALVVNLGEMLQAMTGNYFVATPHRVIVMSETERYSIGYFHGPSLDTKTDLLPLNAQYQEAVAASPRHTHAGFMARKQETDAGVGDMKSDYKPTRYGEQLWNYFLRSYPENMATHYPLSSDG